MARRAQPWYREDRGVWCVTINGTRHNLGTRKKEAFDRFHELMRQPRRQKVVADSVAAIMDPFLDWVDRNRSAATYEWYRCRLQDFVEKHPQLTVEELRPHHVEKWAGLPHLAQTSRRNLMRAVKRSLGRLTEFRQAADMGDHRKNVNVLLNPAARDNFTKASILIIQKHLIVNQLRQRLHLPIVF